MLWGESERRTQSCAVHVEQKIEARRAQMLVVFDELDAMLPAWRPPDRAADAEGVVRALDARQYPSHNAPARRGAARRAGDGDR